MSVVASSNAPLGSYPITVTGTDGHTNHTATVTLTISTSGSVNLPSGTGGCNSGRQPISAMKVREARTSMPMSAQ